MSYDIYVIDQDDKVIYFDFAHQFKGGTYSLYGTNEAWLNITYNYHKFYAEHMKDGINYLHNKRVLGTLDLLETIISKMKGTPSDDYWEATEGNAKAALSDLFMLGEVACIYDKLARWKIS